MNKHIKEFFRWLNEARLNYTVYDDPWFITFRLRIGKISAEIGIKENDDATFSVYEIHQSEYFEFERDTTHLFDCDLNTERGYWTVVDFIGLQVQTISNQMSEKNNFLVVKETNVNIKENQYKLVTQNHLLSLLHASGHVNVFDRDYPDDRSPTLTKNIVVYVKPTEGPKK